MNVPKPSAVGVSGPRSEPRCHLPNSAVCTPAGARISGSRTSLAARPLAAFATEAPMPVRKPCRPVSSELRVGEHTGQACALAKRTPPAASASIVGVGGGLLPSP